MYLSGINKVRRIFTMVVVALPVLLLCRGEALADDGGALVTCEPSETFPNALKVNFADVAPEKDGEVLYLALDVQPVWGNLAALSVEARKEAFVETGMALGTYYICNDEVFRNLTQVEVDYVSIFSADEYDIENPNSFKYYGSVSFGLNAEGRLTTETDALDMDAINVK